VPSPEGTEERFFRPREGTLCEPPIVPSAKALGYYQRKSGLSAEQDHDSRDQGEDRQQNAGSAKTYPKDADDSDQNEIDGEQKHPEVFRYHAAILTGQEQLSRAIYF
jgi:hypothetical protein